MSIVLKTIALCNDRKPTYEVPTLGTPTINNNYISPYRRLHHIDEYAFFFIK